jgi:guanylate kinase
VGGESAPTNLLGNLYIVAAPSGAGKTSLVRHLIESTPNTEVSISVTTRAPRPGEQEGINYRFVDLGEFHALVEKGVFLEHARVFDHFYGTSRHIVQRRLAADVDVVLEIDWQGARQVRAAMPQSKSIFVLPPSREVLRDRLLRRAQDSATVIERRMRDAINEMSHYEEFDYLIINDDFDAAAEALRAIVLANRQRRSAQMARRGKLLSELLS